MTVHVYTRPRQPATRWVDWTLVEGRRVDPRLVHHHKPNALLRTTCCGKRRPAKNLEVQVYYDGVPVWCRTGTGCKIPRRRRPPARVLAREFKAGRSMLGLARKYGMPRAEVETRLRWGRRRA